jgi:hypothetical protein
LHADLSAAFSRARFDHNVDPDDLGCGDATPSPRKCQGALDVFNVFDRKWNDIE